MIKNFLIAGKSTAVIVFSNKNRQGRIRLLIWKIVSFPYRLMFAKSLIE